MSGGKILTAVMIGAAVGTFIGVLFAPDKGSETRRKISQKGSDLSDALKNKFNDFVDAISEKFQSAKEEATDRAEEWKGEVQSSMS
ncbi:MAG TPA: YtxH domain-containing protein [Chitinophagaceae bacterium]|jgi:gas vesicle protein